jgi:NAD(P)-dependent dehydrogenase (short-subunit alcohol dehydrogenase family)
MDNKPLLGQIAVVTGASRGIGYHCAKELARKGVHVIAVARTIGGLEDLDDEIKQLGGECTLVPLDLSDMAGIDRLGGALHERWGKLDIFIANAAILGTISPLAHVEAKVFERLMTLNVNSTWRLIRSFEPLLRKSEKAQALFLSSSVARNPRAFWGPYAASKAAVEMLALCWSEEIKQTNIKVHLIDPGATRTAMRAQAVPGEDPTTLPHPSEVAQKIVHLCCDFPQKTGQLYALKPVKSP